MKGNTLLSISVPVVIALAFAPDVALAAGEGLSSLVTNVGEEAKASVSGVSLVLYFIGFVALAAGIIMGFAANRHGGGGMGKAIALGLLGIILLGYNAFVRKGTVSVYKQEGSGINELQIGQSVSPDRLVPGAGHGRLAPGRYLR